MSDAPEDPDAGPGSVELPEPLPADDPGAAGDPASTRRHLGSYVVFAVAVAWVLVAVTLVTVIGLEALTLDDRPCRVAEQQSLRGEASWQAWPPGAVCTFRDVRLDEPSPWRGVAIVLEVIVGVGLLVVWRRYRDAPDPDWTA